MQRGFDLLYTASAAKKFPPFKHFLRIIQNFWLLLKRCQWRLHMLVLQLHFAPITDCANAVLEFACLQTLPMQPQAHGGGELHSGTACDYLHNSSAIVTLKLLCQPASDRTIPLLMREMQFRVSDSVEPTPRIEMWWNTFPGTIFSRQVCWPQLPLSQSRCNLFLKAARDALEDISSKLYHILLLCVNARWILDCKIFVANIDITVCKSSVIMCKTWESKNFKGPGLNVNLGRWKAVNRHRCWLHTAHLQLMHNFPCNTLSSATIKNTCISVNLFYSITSANPVPE